MNFDGFRWISMDFDEFRWISMGFRWNFNGFWWISIDFDEFRWISMNFDGISMNFDGFWWILMDFDKFFWNLLIFDQNLAFATQKIIIKKFSNFFIFVTNIKTLLKTCFLPNITYQLTVTMKIYRSQYHWSEDTFLQK